MQAKDSGMNEYDWTSAMKRSLTKFALEWRRKNKFCRMEYINHNTENVYPFCCVSLKRVFLSSVVRISFGGKFHFTLTHKKGRGRGEV